MGRLTMPPFERDMNGLARLARIAFAARCARRALAMVPHAWPDGSAGDQGILERAVRSAEETGAGRGAESLTKEVGAALGRCHHPPARRAILAIQEAALCSPSNAAKVASWVCGLVPYTLPPLERFRADDRLHKLVWGDLERAMAAGKEGGWTDATPVEPAFFGPLWPDREPGWFPRTAPGLTAWGEDRPEVPPAKLGAPAAGLPSSILSALESLKKKGFKVTYRPPAPRAILDGLFSRADPAAGIGELRAFYGAHDGAVLRARRGSPGEGLGGDVHLFPLFAMAAETDDLIGWHCTRVWFDEKVRDEEDEYTRSISEPGAGRAAPSPLAPYAREDMLVFARAEGSADCFLMVLRGPLAGKVVYFDHETASSMDRPVASGFADFLERVPGWAANPKELL